MGLIEVLSQNLDESVIPFWLKNSLDREQGGYFSCLDREGRLYDDRKYIWLNARGVWMFSRLFRVYKADPEFLSAATLGFSFLSRYARGENSRVWFSVTRAGQPYAYQRKPFSLAFLILAYHEFGLASGQSDLLSEARCLFRLLRRSLSDASLLGRDVPSGTLSGTSLSEQFMVLAIALEFYYYSLDESDKLVVSEAARAVAAHHNAALGVLMELNLVNSPLQSWPELRLLNPGHSIEAAWLLIQAGGVLQDHSMQVLGSSIIDETLTRAWDDEFGGITYLIDVEGKPCAQLEAPMKLWWSHAEALYATILTSSRLGDRSMERWRDLIVSYIFEKFIDSEHGEWFGYLDRRGIPTSLAKGGSYKGFFHVPRALLFSLQELSR